MNANTGAEEEVVPIDVEADEHEPKRRRGGAASTIFRVFLALAAGGASVGCYVLFKKLQASQAELSATNDTLRGARTRGAAAEARAADTTRQLAAAQAQSQDLQTQLATSASHAHDVEDQLTHAQTEREQLGAQLTAANARAQEGDAVAARLRDLVRHSGGETHTEANGQISLQLVDRVLFSAGEAELTPQGATVLGQVADILRSVPDKQIWIEGHTDIAPVPHPDRFASNWELSTARALSVVHYLQDQAHIDPRRLAVVGFGQYRPLQQRASARNRRIEIVLLPRNLRVQN
jgi:chemotaxis protein MotB